MEFALISTEVVMPTDLNLNPVNWNTLVAVAEVALLVHILVDN